MSVALYGSSALAQAASFLPDVVFLDLNLGTMDGYEVCRRLTSGKERLPRVIAVSGQSRLEERRLHDAGFDDILLKPVAIERLLGLLSQLNSGHHQSQNRSDTSASPPGR